MEQEKPYYRKLNFIRRRCPHLSEEELVEAEKLFIWYVKFIWDMYDELEQQGKPLLTEKERKLFLEDMKRLPKDPEWDGESSNILEN